MNLIGITGKLESGKSTLASMIMKKATIECKRYAFASALKNMCTDYDFRTDMLKSGNFNQNAFDTLINYNRLMDLKESLR